MASKPKIPPGVILRIEGPSGSYRARLYIDGQPATEYAHEGMRSRAAFTREAITAARGLIADGRAIDYATGPAADQITCEASGVQYRQRAPGSGPKPSNLERVDWMVRTTPRVRAGYRQRAETAGGTIGDELEKAYDATEPKKKRTPTK